MPSTVAIAPANCKDLNTWKLLLHSSVGWTLTGTTTETLIQLLTIPAAGGVSELGPNGALRMWTLWSMTNNANNKTPRIRMTNSSGALILTGSQTTQQSLQILSTIRNRNSNSSQLLLPNTSSGFGAINGAVVTQAINTASPWTIWIGGLLANAADSLTLESYMVEVCYKP